MKKVLAMLIAVFTVFLSSCSKETPKNEKDDNNNSPVVETSNTKTEYTYSDYACTKNNHIYYYDPQEPRIIYDYNTVDGTDIPIFNAESNNLPKDKIPTKRMVSNLIVNDNYLFFMVGLQDVKTVKINLATNEMEYFTGIHQNVNKALWMDGRFLYCVKNGDEGSSSGIYKMDTANNSFSLIFSFEKSNAFNVAGIVIITEIVNDTIYFQASKRNATYSSFTISNKGKDLNEICTLPVLFHTAAFGERVFVYGNGNDTPNNTYDTYYIDKNSNIKQLSRVGILDRWVKLGDFIYAINQEEGHKGLYKYNPATPNSTELVTDKYMSNKFAFGFEIIASINNYIVIDDSNNYYVLNVNGTYFERYDSFLDICQVVFGFSKQTSEDVNVIIPSKITDLFDRTIVDFFGNSNGDVGADPIGEEDGGKIYKSPENPDFYLYFPTHSMSERSNYLSAVSAPIEELFPGKNAVTVDDLKQKFRDAFQLEYIEEEGFYFATATVGRYTIQFGEFESQDNIVVKDFLLLKNVSM